MTEAQVTMNNVNALWTLEEKWTQPTVKKVEVTFSDGHKDYLDDENAHDWVVIASQYLEREQRYKMPQWKSSD